MKRGCKSLVNPSKNKSKQELIQVAEAQTP